jgi:hypothetical protein
MPRGAQSAVVLPAGSATATTDVNGEVPLSLAKPQPAQTHLMYKLEAARRLPVANLRLTLSWYLLHSARNLAFLKWAKRRFCLLAWMNRLGLLLGMVAIVIPRQYAPYLIPPACLLALPGACCSYAMLSVDLLKILVKQYEFWFFTIVNVTTWAVLASLCQDVRVAFLLVAFFDTELMVLMDANFRTFVPAVQTCAGAIPVLFVLATLVVLRQVDLPPCQVKPIKLGKLYLEPTEVFANAVLTLLLFLLRKLYNKRKLLYKRHATTRVVRCMLLRCVLVLRPLAARGKQIQREYGSSVVLKKLGITAQKVYPGIKSGRALNSRQQLTLVSLRLSTIDVRKVLCPKWWSRQDNGLERSELVGCYAIGASGLLLSGGSMLLPGAGQDDSGVETVFGASISPALCVGIPVLGFSCTLVFCAVFASAYQRDFLRAMFRNFAFLFPSIQFLLACVCLADSMRWDTRCWAVAAYAIWFHWILLLDALTPRSRKQICFYKHLAVPVVVAVWIGVLSVLYAIIIDSPTLRDRELLRLQLGPKKVLTAGTKSMLLNRILTILLWTMRLMWQILQAGDSELVLLRGTLDYYCPFDTFTGSAKKVGSLKSIVPITGKRRVSEGSMMVLGESSESRMASFSHMVRRVSTRKLEGAPPDVHPLVRRSSVSTSPPLPTEMLRDLQSRANIAQDLLTTGVPLSRSVSIPTEKQSNPEDTFEDSSSMPSKPTDRVASFPVDDEQVRQQLSTV